MKRRVFAPARQARAGRRRRIDVGGWLRAVPAGVLLATVPVLLAAGCGSEHGPGRPDLATLRVEASFGELKTGASPSSVHRVRAEAFELTGAERLPVLRDSAGTTLRSGESHYRIELLVPPADFYAVRLTMEGTTGTPDNPSDDGLLFLGETNLENVRAGSSSPVVINMKATVPIVLLETVEQGWHLSWSPLPGALSYILRETLPPPHGVKETPTMVTDTLVAFPPALKIGRKASIFFQVAARFPAGFTGAFSPKVTGDAVQPTKAVTAGETPLKLRLPREFRVEVGGGAALSDYGALQFLSADALAPGGRVDDESRQPTRRASCPSSTAPPPASSVSPSVTPSVARWSSSAAPRSVHSPW